MLSCYAERKKLRTAGAGYRIIHLAADRSPYNR